MDRLLAAALIVGMCAISTLAGELEDFDRFLDQFTHIERLRYDADYHTVSSGPDGKQGQLRFASGGTYHYAFDDGKFVVESQVMAGKGSPAFYNRIGLYAFTGEHYLIYDGKDEEPEISDSVPEKTGLRIVTNPMIAPIAFLRSDLDPMSVMGLELFNSEEQQREIGKNIASEKVLPDENNRVYIEITIKHERDMRHLGEGRYRVYLSDPEKYKAGFALPERVEYWYNGRRWSTVAVLGYTPVTIGERTLYLPSDVHASSNAGREDMGGVSTAKMGATISAYSSDKLPDSAFRPDLPGTDVSVKPDGTILWDGKPSQCPRPEDD